MKPMFPLCAFLPILLGASLSAAEWRPAVGGDSDVGVDPASGNVILRQLGNVRPQKPVVLGGDVFTPLQMENGSPKLRWKTENAGAQRLVLSTVLKKTDAGIDLDGVEFRKIFEFDSAVPEIRITAEFKNPTPSVRYAYWGARNDFALRPNAFEPAFIPAAVGTYPVGDGMFLDFYSKMPAWTSALAESWSAKINPNTAQGLIFLPENTIPGAFFNRKGTILGFTFDGGYLAPGKTLRTTYAIRPVAKLPGLTTANRNFAAWLASNGKKLKIAVAPYADGSLEGTVETVDHNQKSILKRPVKLTLKKGVPATVEFDQPRPAGHTAVRFSGICNGAPFATEQYCENGVRMQPLPACDFVPFFLRAVPVKPTGTDGAGATPRVPRKNQAICLFGLYTDFNRFDRVLNGWKIDTYSVQAPAMKAIPPASTIDEYAVMIAGNPMVASLEVCLRRIQSFVRNGGVLIVTGGPSAFGTGGYGDNPILREMLPVECKPFDLRPAAKDGKPDVGVAIAGSGIAPDRAPRVYWYHRLRPKPGAETLWTADGEPVLIAGRYGNGRVLCFAGAPLGDPKDGKTPYWDSSEYVNAMRKVLDNAVAEVRK